MRVHLVDGTFELFRAHFSPRPDRPKKATAGFMGSMLWLLDDPDEKATHVAVAFDNPIVSFRNDLFDGYKTDEGIPDDLRSQFDLVEEAALAIGLTVWSMDKWEADDALATAARRFAADPKVEQVRILSPDKDLGQVVKGQKIIQVDRVRKKLIDEDAVNAARGVPPESVPDYLALVGDDADGIPGIAGFGAKGAATLLRRWKTIEAIPRDPAKWDVKVTGAPRLSANLEAERDAALLYKKLATLVFDVPLKEKLADLEYKGCKRAAFTKMADALDLGDVRNRARFAD